MKNSTFSKKLAVFTLTVGLILPTTGRPFNTLASAADIKTDDLLSSLTTEQRNALKQLEVTDRFGAIGFNQEELKNDNEISVIVQFQSKPSKVAILDATLQGKNLSKKQADEQVQKDHDQFSKDVISILPSTKIKNKKSNHRITSEFKTVYNGVAMTLPANEVKQLLTSKVVKAVYKDEEFKIDPIKTDANNETNTSLGTSVEGLSYLKVDKLHKEGITGKGIKVGVIDTGIDYNHPDLKDAYKGGYDFVDNDNDPMETTYKDWQASGYPEYNGSAYYTSHGTHVAGTIAGQATNKNITVEGVAPDVDLYAYRVLGPYGSGSSEAVIEGIEKAVEDGMDVINLSLGASVNDPYFPTSTAINYAVLNGVTAVVAAGNDGPNEYSLGSPGSAALALTVGASDVPMAEATLNGKIGNENLELIGMARHYTDQLQNWESKSYDIVDVGLGYTWDYTDKDLKGKIALVSRGDSTLDEKVINAKQNGAVGVLLYNNIDGQIGINIGESINYVPTFALTKADGEKVKALLEKGTTNITFSNFSERQSGGDQLADFSSRGPARQTYDMKPEVTAPGVSVLSSVPSYMIDPEHQDNYDFAYSRYSGTSMATPFTAGIAALMLQANPELQPEEIKSILMNTADPLKGDYSVFEVGAGRIDPYQAVNTELSIQIKDKAFVPGAERLMKVKELTGGLSFDNHYESGKVNVTKTIKIANYKNEKKSFSVSITESKSSNNLKENGVELNIPTKIDINSKTTKTINASLVVPKEAKKGIYEGYITLTNNKNNLEVYRIPYSFRSSEEGFNSVKVLNPAYSPDQLNQGGWDFMRYQWVYVNFNLRAPMKSMDIILQDAETGKDIGFVGTVNLEGSYDNVDYGLVGFNGQYYSFTGDNKQPISDKISNIRPGHYKLKFIGTSISGKVFTETQHLFTDLDSPSFKSSLDGESPFIEYQPGQKTYPFDIQITDSKVDEMKKFGVNVDQSSNWLVYYYGLWAFPSTPIAMDSDGKYKDEIAMDESLSVLPLRFDGYDNAGNKETKEYYFVKEGTPVTYVTSDVRTAKSGETVKAKLVLDNLNDIKDAKWTFGDYYGMKSVQLVSAKLSNDLVENATLGVSGDDVTVQFKQTTGNFDHKVIAEVTLKVLENEFYTGARIDPSITVTDAKNENIEVANAGYSFKTYPQFSVADGYLTPQGFYVGDPETGGYPYTEDWTKIGAAINIYDSKGTKFNSTMTTYGNYSFDKLPLSKEPFTIEFNIPGHFITKEKVEIGYEYNGTIFGKNQYITALDIKAGDVNQDDVIDILDAIMIQTYWGTNKRSTDINFDGKVDSNDMKFVQQNYLLQNQYADNAPKPLKKYKGNSLENILKALGIQS
ncbi:S8 family serine peptidase [Bacillus sp. EAC]|uniref:S8 family serine peptidase n=1 Tax=Bacillus sp. EAC TaxID=1978338 RepID=UPI000B4539AC|nr:S8 family serine peptidase [Bacillus sp. EAC]